MSLVIAGHVIDPEGTALVGVDVSIAFDNAASFADLAGAWDTQGRYALSIPTDTFGAWSWPVPFSAVDPSDATCSITLPNGVRWSGVLPLSHNGTLSLKDLKDTYSWGLVSTPSASVVAVQGLPGASYPGVTSDGASPGGLLVAGLLQPQNVLTTDPSQMSIFAGGVFAEGQGLTSRPDAGNVSLDAFWNDSGTSRVGLRVAEDGATWIRYKLRIRSVETHTLGAYSGQSFPVYDESDTLIGWVPLYA